MDETEEMIDAQLHALEARSQSLHRQILELKTRRNASSFVPISKLPEEILLNIFALTQTIIPERVWFQEVTHICRRWRRIALEAPTLWTAPPLLRHDFTMLMLERSKAADLFILMEKGTTYNTIECVLQHLDRIHKLDIRLPVKMLDGTFSLLRCIRKPAPRLRRFELRCRGKPRWDSRQSFQLSATIFSQPSFQEFVLSNILFDWDTFPLRNLVSLTLVDIKFSSPVSLQRLLETLRQMPLLMALKIPLSQPPFSVSTQPHIGTGLPVELPLLNFLHLGSSHFDCIEWFLPRFSAPGLRTMIILPPSGESDFSRSSQLAPIIASTIVGGSFGNSEYLKLYQASFILGMLNGEHDIDEYDINASHDDDHVKFCMEDSSTIDATRLFTQTALDILSLSRPSLSHVVELKFDEFSLTVEELLQLSTGLCFVRSIEVFRTHASARALIGVLAMLPPHHPLGANQTIPFPALSELRFSVIDFGADSTMLRKLCDSLTLRSECQIPICDLGIFECWISSEQLHCLKGIVGRVTIVAKSYQ